MTIFTIILSYFVSFGAQTILANILVLQVICNFTVMNLLYPAVTMGFIEILIGITMFDVLSPEPFYVAAIGEDDTLPLDNNFEFAGYSTC